MYMFISIYIIFFLFLNITGSHRYICTYAHTHMFPIGYMLHIVCYLTVFWWLLRCFFSCFLVRTSGFFWAATIQSSTGFPSIFPWNERWANSWYQKYQEETALQEVPGAKFIRLLSWFGWSLVNGSSGPHVSGQVNSTVWMLRLVCTDVTEKSLGEVLQKCRFVAWKFFILKNWWVLRLSVSSCCNSTNFSCR